MKYWIITFGCQMNKADSEKIAGALEGRGYERAPAVEAADLVVVNMCSVRQSAVDRVYGLIPKIKNVKTILTGCILKKDGAKLLSKFDKIIEIKDLIKNTKPKYSNNVSASVPIMQGCDNFCAYCVVPYTRGREISKPIKEIIYEVKNLVKHDYKEIWLLGQNVNSYKSYIKATPITSDRLNCESRNKTNFPQLLKMVNDIPGKFWVRFTSPHPRDFSDELIEVMAKDGKITEYLNLPVQAGDDKVLKRMNRPYTIKHYKNLVKKIRKRIPGITLSTDVIVGFPGETKKQFENTAKLFKEIKYDMAYISKYSPRPGTKGAKLTDNIPAKEKKRREKILTEILEKTALENNRKYIGKTVEILMTDNNTGKTRTNKTVKIQSNKDLLGQFVKIKITGALPWGLKGQII